ncbi:MAG: CoA-acylating methylmalonate-semialdehyde dehydrogenase [bacterium]
MGSIPKFSATSNDFTPFVDAKNWIGGEWVTPSGKESMDVINPRFGKAMAKVQMSTADDVASAVRAAKAAFPSWSEWPMRERAQIMYKFRELMERDIVELSWLVSHENGKLFEEAKAEVLKAIECCEYGCSLPNIAGGPQLEVSRGVECRETYAPLGVCAGITPFNFPFMVPMWMLPQVLVGGNTFVLKPSEQVPLSTLRMAALLDEAGLPKGVFNIVNGAQEVVEAICDHPDIKAIGFVGSTKVAKIVYGRAASHGKNALCLGGAKNHLILVPDADVDVTVDNVLASFTGCAGQRCMAASVLLAVGDVDHLITKIAEKAKAMKVGTDVGAIVNKQSVERIVGYINDAEKRGAKVLVDGRPSAGTSDGYWVGPTILDNVSSDMPAGCEEIFGPVLSIIRVDKLDKAIAIENNNPYGNASCIYTSNGDTARYVSNRVEAGMVGVNVGVPVPREPFGFGGWNHSKFGNGDITGWDGFRFWTRPRKITTKWATQRDTSWLS